MIDQTFAVTLTEREWDEVQLAITFRINRPGTQLAAIQEKIDAVIDNAHRNKGKPFGHPGRL